MKAFKELTVRGQKMRIVRDAISQIQKKVIVPKNGDYLTLTDNKSIQERDDYFFSRKARNIQKILLKGQPNTCQACAKGSLFASCVISTNNVYTIKHEYDDEKFQKKKLHKWFSDLELDMIETAFEERVIADSERKLAKYNGYGEKTERKTELGIKCSKFGKLYKKPDKRLLAILENILKNGSFKP